MANSVVVQGQGVRVGRAGGGKSKRRPGERGWRHGGADGAVLRRTVSWGEGLGRSAMARLYSRSEESTGQGRSAADSAGGWSSAPMEGGACERRGERRRAWGRCDRMAKQGGRERLARRLYPARPWRSVAQRRGAGMSGARRRDGTSR